MSTLRDLPGRSVIPLALLAGSLAACTDSSGRVIELDAVGAVEVAVFFDGDGTGDATTADDTPLAGVTVGFVAAGTRDTVRNATTDADGLVLIADLPVGSYVLAVGRSTFGDTVDVTEQSRDTLLVLPADTGSVAVAVAYPNLSTSEVRSHPVGRRVFVQGVALTTAGAFGDTTLHIADTAGSLRATRVRPLTAVIGDSVRIRGVVALRDGQRVLDDARVFSLDLGSLPAADSISTAVAAAAEGGTRDAALARIAGAALAMDTTTVGGELQLRVDDGSGQLIVGLSPAATFNLGAYLLPGAEISAAGVLVPRGDGTWKLKPRVQPDLAVSVPVISVAEARQLPVGTRVFVDGIALNSRETFGDTTVHVADTSAAIRAVRVARATILPGDSVRVAGVTGQRSGQPVINQATVFVLAIAEVPPPIVITTAGIGTAQGGTLDANLVRIVNAEVIDTVTQNDGTLDEYYQLTVDDGSGTGAVRVEVETAISTATLVPTARIDVTGLLVPDGAGGWLLKPRFAADVTVR
jgi:hypothetical protein